MTSKILIVDDSSFDRTLVGRLLQRAQFQIGFAENGTQAIQTILGQMPDLVLTDLMMPEMDGLTLVGEIRERWPALPVVLMTAHGSEVVAMKALRKGAASYVPKSTLARELAPTLEHVIELTRPARDRQRALDCIVRSETTYRVGNRPDEFGALIKHLDAELARLRLFHETTRLQVCVSLREAMANAAYHGNLDMDPALRDDESGAWDRVAEERCSTHPFADRRISLDVRLTREEATFVVTDQGRGFEARGVDRQDADSILDAVRGRGLLLIRTFMDGVSHNDVGNSITMRKRADAEERRGEEAPERLT